MHAGRKPGWRSNDFGNRLDGNRGRVCRRRGDGGGGRSDVTAGLGIACFLALGTAPKKKNHPTGNQPGHRSYHDAGFHRRPPLLRSLLSINRSNGKLLPAKPRPRTPGATNSRRRSTVLREAFGFIWWFVFRRAFVVASRLVELI